jgi:hypothetical protein
LKRHKPKPTKINIGIRIRSPDLRQDCQQSEVLTKSSGPPHHWGFFLFPAVGWRLAGWQKGGNAGAAAAKDKFRPPMIAPPAHCQGPQPLN